MLILSAQIVDEKSAAYFNRTSTFMFARRCAGFWQFARNLAASRSLGQLLRGAVQREARHMFIASAKLVLVIFSALHEVEVRVAG